MYKEDGGLFGVAMGFENCEISNDDLELINNLIDAEDIFERQMDQISNIILTNNAEEVLISINNAWQCVKRARAAAGF